MLWYFELCIFENLATFKSDFLWFCRFLLGHFVFLKIWPLLSLIFFDFVDLFWYHFYHNLTLFIFNLSHLNIRYIFLMNKNCVKSRFFKLIASYGVLEEFASVLDQLWAVFYYISTYLNHNKMNNGLRTTTKWN